MHVLIVRLSALGDVIQGIPCLVALKESFPDWKISWLTEESSVPVLVGHPHLDRLFVVERNWRKGSRRYHPGQWWRGGRNFWQVFRSLQGESFDLAIDLQGLFKSGMWSWLSGAPRRLGYGESREGAQCWLNEIISERPTFDPEFPLVQRYLEPVRYLKGDLTRARYVLPPIDISTLETVDRWLGGDRDWVAFCPWSAWSTKNWPLERWRELALQFSGKQRLLILGGSENRMISENVFGGIQHCLNLTGQTTVTQLMEIFRRCQCVVGSDSGPLHLANATGVPRILMLFGSTARRRSGPWGEGHRTLALDLPCQPCFKRKCPLGHLDCLNQMEVSQVWKILSEWKE